MFVVELQTIGGGPICNNADTFVLWRKERSDVSRRTGAENSSVIHLQLRRRSAPFSKRNQIGFVRNEEYIGPSTDPHGIPQITEIRRSMTLSHHDGIKLEFDRPDTSSRHYHQFKSSYANACAEYRDQKQNSVFFSTVLWPITSVLCD